MVVVIAVTMVANGALCGQLCRFVAVKCRLKFDWKQEGDNDLGVAADLGAVPHNFRGGHDLYHTYIHFTVPVE